MSRTFLSKGLKVSSEALVAISHPEGQQHDIGGRHQREGDGHRLAQPASAQTENKQHTHINQGRLAVVWRNRPREAAHLCRMRPLIGRRASYMVRASLVQSVGSIRNDATVRRIRNPGVVVSFTWQLTPPQEEKMFNGTLAPGRLA